MPNDIRVTVSLIVTAVAAAWIVTGCSSAGSTRQGAVIHDDHHPACDPSVEGDGP
jgi:hypothetical protein